ncbi:hypothetical protein T029_20035 [Salmonella enterica subsp. enterica serovar Give]|nr:hypothetical protein [Salmonella enterica subsp. enterica serovar Give]ECM4408574.1 hypothetical protein [Salmonella enterica subsp. enterica serovar Give]EED3922832.1 hypothetical protein [Salmonella enterica subsp. enterica serovar Give]EED4548160.1 hypothetical protein [Salmonella enterica subsp. enterica serovar Give]
MPEGILIDYNDGRPAMAITAGLRAPSYCGATSGQHGVGDGTGYDVPVTMTTGSELVTIASRPVKIQNFTNPPNIYYMSSITRNGNSSVTINFEKKGYRNGELVDFDATFLEILPAVTYNEGLFVSNSTDFTAISNQSRLMTCAWNGKLTVNGNATLPVSGIPFGRWDNPDISVSFDGTNIIVRNITYDGRDDLVASATIELAIFNQTAPIAGDGITMTNAAGQVTFSTQKRPMVYDRTIQISDSFQNIGGGYCHLTCTGTQTRMIGGYANIRTKGIVMSGGSIRSAFNRVFGNYSVSGWDATFNRNIGMPLLILPNMY